MSDHNVPDEYTETRREFGRRAINTSEAAKTLFEDLLGGYRTLNNFVNPVGKQPPNQGGVGATGTVNDVETPAAKERDPRERIEGHNPYLVYEVIEAIEKLIEFTESKYL